MKWQPIETAPKDGTEILLYGVTAGEISGMHRRPVICCGDWMGGRSDFPGQDWWNVLHTDGYCVWCRATHWLPLPDPPLDDTDGVPVAGKDKTSISG